MSRFRPAIPALAACVLLALPVYWRQAPDVPPSSSRSPVTKVTDHPEATARSSNGQTAKDQPAAPVSDRPERPLAAAAELELPPRRDLRWSEPQPETSFEEFRQWTERMTATQPGGETRELLEQGLELALKRRSEMADLIGKNPRRALELAVPESVRRNLPADVVSLLEQQVSGRGDLMVQASRHTADCAHGGCCHISRTVTLADGRVFDAHTFGRRGAMPTRDNIAIHGVALDGKLALSDLPGRILDPAEVAALRAQGKLVEEPCRQNTGEPHETSRENGIFIAWDDSRTSCYCSETHARVALYNEEGKEQSGNTTGDVSDLDGVIAFSPWTEGQKKLLIIRVDFPDFPGQVVGDSTLEQLITDMDTVYSDMSCGKATFAALGQGSAITPTVRLPNDSSYYTSLGRVLSAARTAAAAAGYNYLDYSYEVVLTGAKPSIAGSAGVALVGARGAWLHNSQWNITTCAHEVGHNFGLQHSGAWDTDDGSVIGPGEVWDYGNVFDLMGVGPSSAFKRHFSASTKMYLDWLPSSDVVKITANGSTTTRIRALDKVQADGNKRALAVDRAGTSDDYWVEYRQGYGTSYGMRDGVLVNWANINGGYEQPLLLDMKPDTFEKDDAVLPMGRTFSDTAAGIHITPVARGTDPDGVAWMDVKVNRGTFAGNLKPSVSLAASNLNPAVDASVSFTATASDPNGDTPGYFWDWGDGTTTANNSATASKSWSTAGVKTVRCIVTDMKGLTATAQLLVQVGTASTYFIQGVAKTSQDIPMEGVVVRATSTKSDTTDSEGYYAITGLAAGSYTLTATKTGATIQPDGFTNPVTVGPSRQNMNFIAPPGVPYFTGVMKPATADQGSSTGAIPIPLADPDTDVSQLSLSGTSSNTAIIPNGNITFGLLGTSTRTVSVSAGSTVSGTVNITITATDPGGNAASYVWTVTVNAKPVLTVGGRTVPQNVPLDIDLRSFVSDDLTPDELISYLPDRVRNGSVTLLPDGYTARFMPSPDFNGNASFRLVTRDQALGPNFRFFYDFEPPDTHGDARSTDQSNFNRNGTLQSVGGGIYAYSDAVPPALAPQSAKALTLTQSDSSGARLTRTLAVNDHDVNDADWTFSAWVYRASDDTEDFVFHLGSGDGHGSDNELELYFEANSGVLRLQKWGSGGLEKEIAGPNLPTGEWHHITLVFDRTATDTGSFHLYVGPFLRGSVESVSMNVSQSSPLVVGGHASTSANVVRWFDGSIDEVLFQAGVSTRTEIYNRSRMGARHYHGLSASATVNVTVTGTNQPPAIATRQDWFVPTDTTSLIPVALSDAESEHRNLTLSVSSSNTALLPNSNIAVINPQPWTSSDIGSVGAAGSFIEDHGTLLIGGAGADIGPAAGDAFRWVRQSFTGDAEMIARVVSVDHTASDSKAGIMMRESSTATSPFAYICVTPSDGVRFLCRTAASTAAALTAAIPLAEAPCWVRLVRTGTSYTAYYAPDNGGSAGPWQTVGSPQTLAFAGNTHSVGMAVTSKVNASVCTAVFDNLGGTVQRGGERTLSLTPAAGQSGSSIITLTTSDGSSTDSLAFNLVVDGAPPSTTVWSATSTAGPLEWSTGTHWTGGVPPPSSRSSSIGFFTGQSLAAGTIASNNNTTGGHAMNVLTLGGTGPASGSTILNLGGNPLLLRSQSIFDPVVNLTATNGTGLTWNVSAPVTMEATTTFQGAGTAAFIFSGPIGGGGGLVKTGSSKLTLAGTNTYAGTTTISGGTLQVGNDGATGTLPSGAVINHGTLRFDRSGTLPVPNDISGTGGITVDCPISEGIIVLGGNNSFTGAVNITSGALRIANGTALGTTATSKTITLTNGTNGNPQLRLDGSSTAIDLPAGINYRTSNSNGAIINEAGDNILRGDFTLASGGGNTRMVVNSGTLTLNGNIRPNTTGRSLVLSGAGSGSANGIISDGTATGQVLALVKNDSGIWTLAGANTYSGTTNVAQGTLLIRQPGSLHASSAVTVNGGVLGGDGTIGGSVTLAAAGSLAPGPSAGVLTIGGNLNVSAQATGSGKLLFDLATPATSDRIAVKGTLEIGSGLLGFGDFVFSRPGALTHGTYKLITTGGITGSLDAASLSGPVGAFIGTLQLTGNDLELVLAPSGLAAWRILNGATGTIADDHDGDGVSDGIEYFLGGPSGTTTGFTAVPGITNTNGSLSVTWTMGAGYVGTYGTDFAVETSATLAGPWTIEPPSGNVTITSSAVQYTFPVSPGTKRFARLKVMAP